MKKTELDKKTMAMYEQNRLYLIGNERNGFVGFLRRIVNRLMQPIFKRQSSFNSITLETVKYLDDRDKLYQEENNKSFATEESEMERLKTQVFLLEQKVDSLSRLLKEEKK